MVWRVIIGVLVGLIALRWMPVLLLRILMLIPRQRIAQVRRLASAQKADETSLSHAAKRIAISSSLLALLSLLALAIYKAHASLVMMLLH